MNWRAEQNPSVEYVGDTPCCGEPVVTMECRVRQAYGTKCGYVPPAFATVPKRFFRAVTASITSTLGGTVEYTEEPPPDPAIVSGNTSCDYTFAASCEAQSWSANYEYHTDDLGGEESTGTSSGAGEGTGISICPGIHEAWLGTNGPNAFGFTEFSTGLAFTPASLAAPTPGCENWTISYTETRTGHFPDSPEYDYSETATVGGTITACDEYTTEILVEEVDAEAEEAEPGDWGEFEDEATCCGTRDLSADLTVYFVDELEVRFLYVPPCAGGVRITYKVVTITNGVEEEETFTVDNPGGAAIPITLPALPETSGEYKVSVCVTEFSAAWL